MTYCHSCGIEAPTRPVAFYQNIGMLLVHRKKRIKGKLCSRCIHRSFWRYTATTFFLGWWSVASLILGPFFLLNNVFRYVFSLGLKAPAANAVVPVLTEDAVAKLQPFLSELVQLAAGGTELDNAALIVASKAGVTPAQVVLYYGQLVLLVNQGR